MGCAECSGVVRGVAVGLFVAEISFRCMTLVNSTPCPQSFLELRILPLGYFALALHSFSFASLVLLFARFVLLLPLCAHSSPSLVMCCSIHLHLSVGDGRRRKTARDDIEQTQSRHE